MKCWASELGGCGGGQSGEHLISANIWSGPSIDVQGFAWCKNEPRRIGVPSLTANILCRMHNSALSPVDVAGGVAFSHLGSAASLATARSRIPHVNWLLQCFRIDGPMLERWFLKSLINLHLVQNDAPLWPDGVKRFNPPLDLVRAAYGLAPLAPPRGLYVVASMGEAIAHLDGVEFGPLFTKDDILAGGVFKFVGYRFMLSLFPESLPPNLNLGGDPAHAWHDGQPLYHLSRINQDVGARRSHFVDFEWPDRHSDHFAA